MEAVIEEAAPTADQRAMAHEAEVAAEAEAVAHVVEDDDILNLPPPPRESLGRSSVKAARAAQVQRESASRTLGFKQTLIPILLTMGTLFAGVAGYNFLSGDDSAIAGSKWISFTLLGTGVVLLGFALLTMLQVRHQMAQEQAAEPQF